LLGVSGGIAAYKACFIVRQLRESGHEVVVVPTEAALRFVGAPTWEALSGRPVSTSVWSDVPTVAHVELGRWAELVIVAPATADLLARASAGIADDLLTTSLLTATCPVLMCPAMHTEMWQHPATQANVSTLQRRGVHILPPDSGRLTGADSGPGRLPDPGTIVELGLSLVAGTASMAADLSQTHVLISAGGTREPLDPVRFLGNRSSGRQGVALAERARDRGARVTLVAAHLEVPAPDGVSVIEVGTAEQMNVQMQAQAESADVIVMAAAVADFRPVDVQEAKIKKSGGDPPPLALTRNPDVLAGLTAIRRPGQVFVGFAAETADADQLLVAARKKLVDKGCDILVANDVSEGKVFGDSTNEAIIVDTQSVEPRSTGGSKSAVADTILDVVVEHLGLSG